MVDKVARLHGKEVFETPVGFKYIGELLCKGCVVIGGEESAGLSVKGHVPEKDGILAGLFALEMVAKRNETLLTQFDKLTAKVGGCETQRINIDLKEDEKATFLSKIQNPPNEFAGKKVVDIITKDGHKFILADGSWILFRLSGTEPVARIYVEASDEEGLQSLIKDALGFICGE
jgi:phosphoglucomutase